MMHRCDLTEYDEFITDPVIQDSKNKRTRILHICNSVKLNNLIEKCFTEVSASSSKHEKNQQVANILLMAAMRRYNTDEKNEVFEKIVQNLNEAIAYAPFGEETFVEAYSLRAKCNLKLSKFRTALHDSTVAIKYGGLNFERILVKAIALLNLCCYKTLKEFIFSEEVVDAAVDRIVEKEIEELGLDLTFECLKVETLFKSSFDDQDDEEDVVKYIESLEPVTNFSMNYQLNRKVKIIVDGYKGRHMLAKDFIPKDTVILVERSFSVCCSELARVDYCLYCNARCDGRSIPCKYCIDVVFCNEDCFEKGWRMFHQHECTIVPLFNECNYRCQHPYRSLVRVGMWNAISVHEKFSNLQSDPEIQIKATSEDKSVARVVQDTIVDEYISSGILRSVPPHDQTEKQRIQVYEMHNALLDHNELFETFFDMKFMSKAIKVALLLLLNEHLRDVDTPVKFRQIDMEEMREMLRENEQKENIEDFKIFGFSIDVFVKLVEIVLLGIRKFETNLFNWQQCAGDRKSCGAALGTCQVLVGTLINHSCDPNVSWSFHNGCLVYITTRGIYPGDEINNSYGPRPEKHGWTFIDRQNKLAFEYNFNCCCTACIIDVADQHDVLQCLSCFGPVVAIPNSCIQASCMYCHKEYINSRYQMLRVNQKRANFRQLWRALSLPSVFTSKEPLKNRKISYWLNQMTDSIEYQLTYLYKHNRNLQNNLMLYCWILVRFGQLFQACFYAQRLWKPDVPDKQCTCKLSYTGFKSTEKSIQDVQIGSFFCELFQNFVDNFETLQKEEEKKTTGETISLFNNAEKLIDYFKQKLQVDMDRLEQSVNDEDEDDEPGCTCYCTGERNYGLDLKSHYQILIQEIRNTFEEDFKIAYSESLSFED